MWGGNQNNNGDDDDSAMLTITGQWNIDAESRAPPPRRSIQQRPSSGSSHGGDRDSGRFSFTEKNRSNSGRFSFSDKNRSGSGLGREAKAARFSFGEKNRSASGLLGVGSGSTSGGASDGNLGLIGIGANDSGGTRGSGKTTSSGTKSSSRFSSPDKNRSGGFNGGAASTTSGLFSVAERSRSEDEDGGSVSESSAGSSSRPSRFSFTNKDRSFSSMLITISNVGLEEDDAVKAPPPPPKTWKQKASDFYWDNEVTILLALSIICAKPYPKLGAVYLVPHVTSTWIAVMLIFSE